MQRFRQGVKRRAEIKNMLLFIIGRAKKFSMFLANKIMGVNNKKVVFISFGGKSYSDNPKAISEKLHEMQPDFEIVWLFNNFEEKKKIVPNYVKCVKNSSIIAILELATAKYWVDNFNKNATTYKSKKQVYIQTWHGDRGFKKIAYDSPFFTRKLIESEICDLFISGSEYGERKIRTAFKYSGEIMKTGCPRNDVLVKDNGRVRSLIKEKINLNEDTCVLLYAPTLRRDVVEGHKLQSYNDIDLVEVIKTLEKMTKMKWLCLIRAHSAVDGLGGIPSSEIDIIDVTTYEDMSDLLLISDLLITDYSSSAGDFVLLNRPLVLFQPDRENYNKYDRPFYFDMEQSPYMIAKNQENLIEIVQKIDKEKIPQNCREIRDFYGTVETGEASKNVVEYMLSKK